MTGTVRPGRAARISLGLTILIALSISAKPALAADNIWQDTFGQGWFYEVRSSSGQMLAGTWWEALLSPGNTYNISFDVQNVSGNAALLVGDNPAATINHKGHYSYDFNISNRSKRRIAFISQGNDVMASVSNISVTRKWTDNAADATASSNAGGGGNSVPKGHYVAFADVRNLKTQILDPLAKPAAASSYQLSLARKLANVLQTPGVKGIWMRFDWRSLEVADGVYDWRVLDADMAAARKYGLKFIVQVADRSFDGTNILPKYFPAQDVLRTSNGGSDAGVVAKRWDPYVYNRQIRLYKAIARRYANDAAFGGIATTETALGNFKSGDYSLAKYQAALTQVINQTEAAMTRGRLFLYLNFLKDGVNIDMNKDQRPKLIASVPHGALVLGGPDVTPDLSGMPRSVTNYRIHVRRTMPSVSQFCHMQHTDLGQGGIDVKTNRYRQQYYDDVAAVRRQETRAGFKGTRGVFEFDDIRDRNGNRVKLHPASDLGHLWPPEQLFAFGQRNFGCDYVIWHYREWPRGNEFGWPDVQPVILNNQYFYNN